MLHSRTKTVFQIEMGGDGGLVEFITDVYELDRFYWGLDDGNIGDFRLFEVDANTGEYLIQASTMIMTQGQINRWLEVNIMLHRLCRDQFIPSGNYLVHLTSPKPL